jgi:hypothetical protein
MAAGRNIPQPDFSIAHKKPAEAGSSKTITTPCREQSLQMADHP